MWAAATSALIALPQWILFVTYPFTFSARVSNPYDLQGASLFLSFRRRCDQTDKPAVGVVLLLEHLLQVSHIWIAFDSHTRRGFGGWHCGRHLAEAGRISLADDGDDVVAGSRCHSVVNPGRLLLGFPFIFIVAGLGTATIWAWIESRRRFPHWIGYLIVVLVLLSGLFRQWDFARRVRPQLLAFDGHGIQPDYIGNHLDLYYCPPTSISIVIRRTMAEQLPDLKQGENVTSSAAR